MMRKLNILFFIIGVLFFIKLVIEYDMDAIWQDLCAVRYGFLWVILIWSLVVLFDTITWKHTFGDDKSRLSFLNLGLIMTAGQAINNVAPSGNLGELVKGKYLADHIGGRETVSSLIIFNFLHLACSIGLIFLGSIVSLFIPQVPAHLSMILIGITIPFIGAVFTMVYALNRGVATKITSLIRRLRIPIKEPDKWVENARQVDKYIREFYTMHPRDFFICLISQILSRLCSVVEVFVICWLLGKPIDISMSFLIISLSILLFWLFAMVPGQIGVMEQSSESLFSSMGYQAGMGFSFELVRRARRLVQITLGLIVLLFLSWRHSAKEKVTAYPPSIPRLKPEIR